jgi:hypothetical protein
MENKKCAPSKIYSDGSCFTLEAIKSIVQSYNKNAKNSIEISDNKSEMCKQLEIAFSDKCNTQLCWTRLSVVKEIENEYIREDIEKATFRPDGPKKRYEWLSNSDIYDVISQYQYKYTDFVFLGALPADFEELPILGISNLNFNDFEKEGKTKLGMVINLDDSRGNGSHWVALFVNLKEGLIYYFDSVGTKPYERTKKFINKIVKYLYNKKYKKDININKLLKITNVILDFSKFNKKYISDSKNNISDSKNTILEPINNMKAFDIRYNSTQHQTGNSECGVYSINFIVRLVGGESFNDIVNNITKDKEVNKCRTVYFNNVNF